VEPGVEDGLVLIDGALYPPAEVTRLAGLGMSFRAGRNADGRVRSSVLRRYVANYGRSGEHDATTPSMAAFSAVAYRAARGR
jgi:hypothetical protein